MVEPITVTLPADVKQALDDFSKKEGVSAEEVVKEAVRQHLFLRRFHSLRERLSAKAQAGRVALMEAAQAGCHWLCQFRTARPTFHRQGKEVNNGTLNGHGVMARPRKRHWQSQWHTTTVPSTRERVFR